MNIWMDLKDCEVMRLWFNIHWPVAYKGLTVFPNLFLKMYNLKG